MMLSNIRNGLKYCPRRKTTAVGLLRLFNYFDIPPYDGICRSFSLRAAAVPRRRKLEEPRAPIADANAADQSVRPPAASEIPHWVQTPIDLAMFKAQSTNDLWRLAAKYELSGHQAVSFFVSLSKFASTDDTAGFQQIAESPKKEIFDMVVEWLLAELKTLPVGSLSLALRSLLSLGVPEDAAAIVELREKLQKNFYLLSPPTLLTFANHHLKYADSTQLGKQLQGSMLQWLFSRAKQFNDPNDALALLSLMTRQESAYYRIMEEKLLELLPSFNGEQLCRLVNILASKRVRSVSLLKGVANRYVACEDDLTVKKLAGFLSDLGSLNFPNMKILTVLCRDIEMKVDTVTKPSQIAAIFSSLAIMRLRCVELLEALCRWTQKELDDFSAEELATVVVALARCNYTPKDNDGRLIDSILKKAWKDKAEYEKSLWLDFVWSLAILQRLDKPTAASVLDKGFYEALFNEIRGNDYKLLMAQLKVRNINTAARLEIAGYNGPLLQLSSSLKAISQVNVVHYKEESVKVLTDALNNLAPREKYMKTNVVTPEGYVIDALVHLTEAGRPLSIDQWDEAPPNSLPVAVMVRHFNEVTQFSASTIGLHAMATRHLSALRYVVIEIPASEIEQRRQPLARVKFLKDKLDEVVTQRQHPENDTERRK